MDYSKYNMAYRVCQYFSGAPHLGLFRCVNQVVIPKYSSKHCPLVFIAVAEKTAF